MSTSGSYDFSITRNDIIQEAFRKIGALGENETIAADTTKLNVGIAALNPMAKAWQAYGMQMWCRTDKTVLLSALTTSPTTIGPASTIVDTKKYLKLLQAIRRDTSSNTDVPLNLFTYENFNMLSTKTSTGAPLHVHYQPTLTAGTIYLWPLPDTYWTANGSIIFTFQRTIQDFDSSTDEPDFPIEWAEALIYNLAVRIAPNYGLPPNDRDRLKGEAKESLELAKSFDQEEGSLFFQPRYFR